MLWSDHGYHLGHKQHWEKRVLWEQATHVPLIIVDKRIAASVGKRCDAPVSLLDIYPTLSDLCEFELPSHLEGKSLKPWLYDTATNSDRAVVTTYQFKNHSLRSQHWRYIRYADGGEELYDHRTDPGERQNVAALKSSAGVKNRLKAFLPEHNAPQENVRQLKIPDASERPDSVP